MNPVTSKLTNGTSVMLNGQEYTLAQLVGNIWNAIDKKTGKYVQIPGSEIVEHYKNGTIRIAAGSVLAPGEFSQDALSTMVPLDMLPEETQVRIRARRLYLTHLEKHFGPSPSGKSIIGHLKTDWSRITKDTEKMPSMQTIRRWLKKYQKSGKNILVLEGLARLRGNTTRKIDEKLEELGLEALHSIYLRMERSTLKSTLSLFTVLVKKENALRNPTDWLKTPTITMLRSILNRLDPFEVHAERWGVNAARLKFRDAVDNYIADGPFDRYEIDHTRLDIGVVDSETGAYLGRPWLTLVISKAGAIVGFIVSMQPPSGESLAKAFKHAILPKNVKEKYPHIKNDWDMFGVPILVVCDNGAEFYGKAFIDMCLTLGIRVEYMPRKTPWWKGSVERTIRTLNSGVGNLVGGGRTFGSIEEKGDYDPVKTAVMTLEQVEEAITVWIVDIYHQTRHRRLKTTPDWMWKTLVNPEDIVYLENPEIFDSITGQITKREWWHYGIQLNNVIYNSHELKQAWTQLIGNKSSIPVTIRWSVEEVGQITVMVPDRNPITVPAKPEFASAIGKSLSEYNMTRQDRVNKILDAETSSGHDQATVHLFQAGQGHVKQQKTRIANHKKVLAAAAKAEKPSEVIDVIPSTFPIHLLSSSSSGPVFKSSFLPTL